MTIATHTKCPKCGTFMNAARWFPKTRTLNLACPRFECWNVEQATFPQGSERPKEWRELSVRSKREELFK